MSQRLCRRLSAAFAVLSVTPVFAQKFNQPYTVPRGAHESRVVSCGSPNPTANWRIAADDFMCPTNDTIVRVCWFGVVSSQAQLNPPPAGSPPRRYLVRIWNTAGAACKPNNPIFTQCVTPSNKHVSTDCQGRKVYRFSAPLAPVFTAAANTKYWLQISEIDAESATIGSEDFRWSGHRPSTAVPHALCPAVQRIGPTTAWICPIFDDCPNPVEDDLAFCLHRQTIIGTLNPFGVLIPSPFALDLYTPAGQLVQTLCVPIDDDGSFAVEADVPPGAYQAVMTGAGARPLMANLQLAEAGEAMLGFFDVFFGDLNADDAIDLMDYSHMQNNFTGP